MGDRCSLELTVIKEDLEEVNEAMFNGDNDYWNEINDNGDETVTLVSYEANYGYDAELRMLAEADIIFEGSHGSGGEYDAGLFACCNSEYICVTASEAGPMVLAGRNGVDEDALNLVYKYYAAYDSVEKQFAKHFEELSREEENEIF